MSNPNTGVGTHRMDAQLSEAQIITRGLTADLPADAATGYRTGHIYIATDGSAGAIFFVNEGDEDSADFNVAL